MTKQRLFVDMDGVLAKWKQIRVYEDLYERGFFLSMTPQTNVVEAVRLLTQDDGFEVYVLSALLGDSKYARFEKNRWLDEYLPEVKEVHRIFVSCGTDKSSGVPGGIKSSDLLLDDYSVNLWDWDKHAVGIKLINDVNNTVGTWMGHSRDAVSYDWSPEEIAEEIKLIAKKGGK